MEQLERLAKDVEIIKKELQGERLFQYGSHIAGLEERVTKLENLLRDLLPRDQNPAPAGDRDAQ